MFYGPFSIIPWFIRFYEMKRLEVKKKSIKHFTEKGRQEENKNQNNLMSLVQSTFWTNLLKPSALNCLDAMQLLSL